MARENDDYGHDLGNDFTEEDSPTYGGDRWAEGGFGRDTEDDRDPDDDTDRADDPDDDANDGDEADDGTDPPTARTGRTSPRGRGRP